MIHGFTLDHLGCNVAGGAGDQTLAREAVSCCASDAEIGDFHLAFLIDKQVLGL